MARSIARPAQLACRMLQAATAARPLAPAACNPYCRPGVELNRRPGLGPHRTAGTASCYISRICFPAAGRHRGRSISELGSGGLGGSVLHEAKLHASVIHIRRPLCRAARRGHCQLMRRWRSLRAVIRRAAERHLRYSRRRAFQPAKTGENRRVLQQRSRDGKNSRRDRADPAARQAGLSRIFRRARRRDQAADDRRHHLPPVLDDQGDHLVVAVKMLDEGKL